ncbi:MAG: cytochrome C oxidase subunit III [Gemmatimonadota bacterium]
MKPIRVVADVSQLPDVTFGPRSTTWWGTVGFMVTEGLTLVICAFAYLYLRKNFYHYPPEGTRLPSLGIPVIQLIVMLLSIIPMFFAARYARRLDVNGTRIALLIALVIKLAILVLRWYEFPALNTQWNSDAYGSAAWIVMGFHTTLLILDVAEDAGFALILWTGRARARTMSDVVDDVLYWYFTVAAWVPLFVLLFLYPRWT